MITPDALEGFNKTQIYNNTIPIGLLNYNYNLMDTLAEDNNLIDVSGLLFYDVAGRTQSPYKLKNTTVAAILADTITGTYVNYQLFSTTHLQNTSLGISSLKIDFGDGSGQITVSINQPISINYPSVGLKTIKYIITYSNAQQVITYSKIYIKNDTNILGLNGLAISSASCNGIEYPETLNIVADIAYQGYEENTALKGEGIATIFYHDSDCDRVFKKPIIIIDGFDPGSLRKVNKIYELLQYDNGTPNTSNLALELINKGYDVIILDFLQYSKGGKMIDGGSDYIQRNAFTLMKLITTINGLKPSGADDLIIVGPSMGGLISRYALTYMEQHNMPHDTKLWISFDAPHLGANIPIGDQWMLKYLGVNFGNANARKKLDEKLNTPAAKEMIIHHYLYSQQIPTPHFTRNLFMQELTNMGFPLGDPGKPIRDIALTNGSGIGALQNNFGGLALQFSVQPTTVARIIGGVSTLLRPRRLLYKIVAKLLGINLNSSIINTKVWFTPGFNGNNKVFEGSMFNGLIQKREYFAGTPNNSIGLDNASGGLYDTQKQIKDGLNEKLDNGFGRLLYKPVFNTFIGDHSFIPIKSSLAISGTSNFGDNFSNRNLLINAQTPFKSYFTPNSNELHVSLTNCSVKWITEEIKGNPQIPFGINYTITGSPIICTSGTYTIGNLPLGAIINWSVTGTISISGSATGSSVNIASSSTGSGTITASITAPVSCGNKVLTKNVIGGGYPNSNYTSFVKNTVTGGRLLLSSIASQPGSTYVWKLNGSIISTGASSTINAPDCNANPFQIYYDLELKVTNSCGQTSIKCSRFEFDCPGLTFIQRGNCAGLPEESIVSTNDYEYMYYPNPAESELNIIKRNIYNTSASDLKGIEIKVELYNAKGEVIRSGVITKNQNDIKWNTVDISNGTYFLHIFETSGTLRKQILIKH